jgi:uncharacterized protein YjiS (DUF1127 family)
MSRQTCDGAPALAAAPGDTFSANKKSSSTRLQELLTLISLWAARRHQRKGLRELADQNDHLLRDMGIPRDQALVEAAKPFWKR